MCGICGKVMFDQEHRVADATLRRMADTITHRGPDDEGFYLSGQVGLGFRRLAIIDLVSGHQPLTNETGTIWIVFNGEIYNYQSLRKELIAKGHTFKTNSDTEVLVHAYEEYGTECVQQLRGMFAFAIWDGDRQTLFMARDRVGIKPLYYYVGADFLSFGSEVKALLADPAVRRDVDPELIDRFLTYYYLPGNKTLFRNLFKLEPGHTLSAKNGTYKIQRYWDLNFSIIDEQTPQQALERTLVDLLDETVQSHLISDVPVGLLLSGGVDSTAMLSFAAGRSAKPVSTFTIGFTSDSVVDERPFARRAAERYGSHHHEMSISPDDFASFLPRYVWHMEEPVCQPSAIALYYVSKLAREYVKVLISGEGSDEAFAGYETYRNLFWFERLKRTLGPLQPSAGLSLTILGRILGSQRLAKYGARMGVPFENYFLSRTSSPFEFFPRERARLYSDAMARSVDGHRSGDVAHAFMARAAKYSHLNQMLYIDTHTWLPDELLIKADKMTMANSVELRVPFLDHNVLEFAARLPRNQKIRGLTKKYLLKKALKGHVPDAILNRRKAGFPVPYQEWLRSHLRNWVGDILLDRRSLDRNYFRREVIEELVTCNAAGTDYSKEVFSLVALELWHRAFVDGYTAPGPLEAPGPLSGRTNTGDSFLMPGFVP